MSLRHPVVFSLQMFIVILYEVFTIVYDTSHNAYNHIIFFSVKEHDAFHDFILRI